MLERYDDLKARLTAEEKAPGFNRKTIRPLKIMLGWLEHTICNTQPQQGVVDQRHTNTGDLVTQEMFDQKQRIAHICPFVRDSLDTNIFWFEESRASRQDVPSVISRLNEMIDEFVNTDPRFDPRRENRGAPAGINLKTFMLVLPRFKTSAPRRTADSQGMDKIHAAVRPRCINAGLMLGQFYPQCPVEGIYNKSWAALTSPFPAFAIRYMAQHDHLFISGDLFEIYQKYFPVK